MTFVARPTFEVGNKVLSHILDNNQVGIIAAANSGSGSTSSPDSILTEMVSPPQTVRSESSEIMGKTPTQFDVDLRCSRHVPLGEQFRLEVFAEFQNLFNTNSIVASNNVIVPTNPITGEMIGPVPDFRAPNRPTSQESRQLQLGVKFIF